jgi:hypothetical protein
MDDNSPRLMKTTSSVFFVSRAQGPTIRYHLDGCMFATAALRNMLCQGLQHSMLTSTAINYLIRHSSNHHTCKVLYVDRSMLKRMQQCCQRTYSNALRRESSALIKSFLRHAVVHTLRAFMSFQFLCKSEICPNWIAYRSLSSTHAI